MSDFAMFHLPPMLDHVPVVGGIGRAFVRGAGHIVAPRAAPIARPPFFFLRATAKAEVAKLVLF